jgi:glutamate N-acetyltransferase / amino-acid N-acetyltransferase
MKVDFDQDLAKSILSNNLIRIVVDLKGGEASAISWGCDMSLDYVKANAYLDT